MGWRLVGERHSVHQILNDEDDGDVPGFLRIFVWQGAEI